MKFENFGRAKVLVSLIQDAKDSYENYKTMDSLTIFNRDSKEIVDVMPYVNDGEPPTDEIGIAAVYLMHLLQKELEDKINFLIKELEEL